MLSFSYRAYTSQGKMVAGAVEAASEAAATAELFKRGLFPYETRLDNPGKSPLRMSRLRFARTQDLGQLSLVTRELAALLSADVRLDEALQIIAAGDLSAAMRKLVEATLARIREGASLSEALGAAAPVVPGYYLSLVQAGEASGSLADVLADLSTLLQRSVELRQKLLSSLLYPLILLAAAAIAVGLVLTVLLPSLAPLLADSGAEVPAAIQALMALQGMLAANWPLALAAASTMVFGILLSLRRPASRLRIDRLLLQLPLIGAMIARLETARLTRTLGTLLRGGVPLVVALSISRNVVANRFIQRTIETVRDEVIAGRSLGSAMKDKSAFSATALRLVGVGEETGRLDKMLLHAADLLEAQSQRKLERLLTLLTPVITVVMGLGVGGLVLSVMSAILSVNEMALR